jgi:hypothetical protein
MTQLHETLEGFEEQLRPAVPATKPPLPAHLQGNPHVIEVWDPARGHYEIIHVRFCK